MPKNPLNLVDLINIERELRLMKVPLNVTYNSPTTMMKMVRNLPVILQEEKQSFQWKEIFLKKQTNLLRLEMVEEIRLKKKPNEKHD